MIKDGNEAFLFQDSEGAAFIRYILYSSTILFTLGSLHFF